MLINLGSDLVRFLVGYRKNQNLYLNSNPLDFDFLDLYPILYPFSIEYIYPV